MTLQKVAQLLKNLPNLVTPNHDIEHNDTQHNDTHQNGGAFLLFLCHSLSTILLDVVILNALQNSAECHSTDLCGTLNPKIGRNLWPIL
jgi:hypothetical protein